jgi:hypothetical protein
VASYLSLNRLKKGVNEDSVGTQRFVTKVIEPALLKEQARPQFRKAQHLNGYGVSR